MRHSWIIDIDRVDRLDRGTYRYLYIQHTFALFQHGLSHTHRTIIHNSSTLESAFDRPTATAENSIQTQIVYMYGMPFYSSCSPSFPCLSTLIKALLESKASEDISTEFALGEVSTMAKMATSSSFNPTRMSLCMHVDLKLLTRIRCIDPYPIPEMQSINPILFTTKRHKTKIMVQYMWNTELIPYLQFWHLNSYEK